MWLRAIYHTRERSCLVTLRDGYYDNDNATFEYITFSKYILWERSGSHGVACSLRGHSCLVALRDGRCDNDDATFDSFPLLYIGGG